METKEKNLEQDIESWLLSEGGYVKGTMGVATYKTADEMDPELLKALPPKEALQKLFMESSKKKDEV